MHCDRKGPATCSVSEKTTCFFAREKFGKHEGGARRTTTAVDYRPIAATLSKAWNSSTSTSTAGGFGNSTLQTLRLQNPVGRSLILTYRSFEKLNRSICLDLPHPLSRKDQDVFSQCLANVSMGRTKTYTQ